MTTSPSVVHMCVQWHPLSNYLARFDEMHMNFYQSCSNGFGCKLGYENQKYRFLKKAI